MAGIYLPLLHTADECIRAPLVLAYFENHFLAVTRISGASTVPLCRHDGRRLPVPFLTKEEEEVVEILLDDYLTRTQLFLDDTPKVSIDISLDGQQAKPPAAVAALTAAYSLRLLQLYKEDCQARCVTPGCKSYKRKIGDLCCTCSLKVPRSPPPSRQLCKNTECDFFGNAKNGGYCSVCQKKRLSMAVTKPDQTTAAMTCTTPGCKSTELEWKNFCSTCVKKMTALWMSHCSVKEKATAEPRMTTQSRGTAERTSPMSTISSRPLPAAQRRQLQCRNYSCPGVGRVDLGGFCLTCYRGQQEAMYYQTARLHPPRQACRNSIPRDPLLSSWPFFPGHV